MLGSNGSRTRLAELPTRVRMPSRNPSAKRRTAILMGAALTAAAAALNWIWLFRTAGGGRVRDTGLFVYLGPLHAAGKDPSDFLPALFHVYRELHSFGDWLSSVCWPIAAGALSGALLGVLLMPAARRAPGFCLRMLAFLTLFPALLPPSERLAAAMVHPETAFDLGPVHAGGTRLAAWGLATAGVCLLLAAATLRSDSNQPLGGIRRLARRAGSLAAAVFTVSLLAASYRGLAVESALPPPPGSPNVLLISIDALRPDRLGCYGHGRETSPTIDRLAAEGVVFETAIAPSSWTLPSHATLLTSLDPLEHGVISPTRRIAPSVTTLAEAFRFSGYRTAGFAAAPFVNARYGFRQGFDFYDDYTVGSTADGANLVDVTSPASFRAVSKYLHDWRSQGAARPFFVFLHLWDVHDDYAPPPPYDTMFDPDYSGGLDATSLYNSPEIHAGMDPRDLEHLQALYDGEIRWVDDHLARLVETLESWSQLDHTVIALTSDHGDEFFEHGDKGHRTSLHDELIRVPLVMRYPAVIPAGLRIDDPVRLVDVGATLLSLSGAPSPPSFGAGAGPFPPVDLAEWFAAGGKPEGQPDAPAILDLQRGPNDPHWSGIRTRDRKLLVDLRSPARVEIYDLIADPAETENLAAERDPADEQLRRALTRARDMAAGAAAESSGAGAAATDALRSLGYIQ